MGVPVERHKRSNKISLLIFGTCVCIQDTYFVYIYIYMFHISRAQQLNGVNAQCLHPPTAEDILQSRSLIVAVLDHAMSLVCSSLKKETAPLPNLRGQLQCKLERESRFANKLCLKFISLLELVEQAIRSGSDDWSMPVTEQRLCLPAPTH